MSLSKVNAGHVAGQAVLIADQRRKNGFDVYEKRCQKSLFTMRVVGCYSLSILEPLHTELV